MSYEEVTCVHSSPPHSNHSKSCRATAVLASPSSILGSIFVQESAAAHPIPGCGVGVVPWSLSVAPSRPPPCPLHLSAKGQTHSWTRKWLWPFAIDVGPETYHNYWFVNKLSQSHFKRLVFFTTWWKATNHSSQLDGMEPAIYSNGMKNAKNAWCDGVMETSPFSFKDLDTLVARTTALSTCQLGHDSQESQVV